MHEGGHGSLTGDLNWDIRIQEVFYNWGCCMSASYWRNQHNKHHAAPQKMDHDVDLNTIPLVAFNVKCFEGTKGGKIFIKSNFYKRVWLPMQAVLFPVFICFLVLCVWMFFLHPRHIVRTKKKMEAFWLFVAHFTAFGSTFGAFGALGSMVGLPALACLDVPVSLWDLFPQWSFLTVVGVHFGVGLVSGPYIFCNFAVSHTHLDVIDADKHVTWVEYSTKHTMNCQNHWFTNWWMSYLNFQIEHHLWPRCPQFRFPQIAPRVEALMKKHGEPYLNLPYFEAMKITFQNLQDVADEVAEGTFDIKYGSNDVAGDGSENQGGVTGVTVTALDEALETEKKKER